MKLKLLIVPMMCIALIAPLNAAEEEIELKTSKDKMSYVAGTQYGNSLKRQGIEPNFEVFIQAVKDVFEGREPRFNQDEIKQIMIQYQTDQQKKQAVKLLGDKAWKVQLEKPEMMSFEKNREYFWILETNKGTIKLKLMPETAPMHVTSTIFLTKKGFYDGLSFHRVIPGFMAQGGCPLGTGAGDPGYQYEGEFSPDVRHDRPYLLSMANAGPGTDGSQFFITFIETPHLNDKHTIFGTVVEGKKVVKKLEAAGSSSGKPNEPLIIKKASIEENSK